MTSKPAIGAAAIMCLLGGIFFSISGGGIGHFSPDTLQSAAQSEWYVFQHHVLTMPARYHEMPLVTYLVKKNYWQPRNAGNPRWILSFRWVAGQHDGESRLHRELSWNYDAWIDWSDQHPNLARELWPLVLQTLRSPRWSPDDGKAITESLLFQGPRGLASANDFQKRVASTEAYYGPIR